ncbi:MAG: DUF1501 domain-containing protein, partial [Planctomycetaceae bacterium]|nr:DUF1501 domain-containing protein [Planctomycetaceae bacterium]
MDRYRNCEGFTRRNCLQFGLTAFLGTGLVEGMRLRSESAVADRSAGEPAAKSCILIWLDGGPTHYETFDPKPQAPVEIRGEFEPIPTRTAGVSFSQHLEKLSQLSDRFSVIRSIRHNQGNHGAGNHYMMTGAPPRIPVGCGAFVSFHPSFGSVVSHERGTSNGLPAYFSIPRMSRSGGPNFLGAKHAPFVVPDDPNSGSFRVRDVALPAGLTAGRFDRRTDLRQMVDRLKRIDSEAAGDPVPSLDDNYRQGLELVTSRPAQEAFDIHQEPDSVRERYTRTSFGQRALLGRRLVEAGVPFIT